MVFKTFHTHLKLLKLRLKFIFLKSSKEDQSKFKKPKAKYLKQSNHIAATIYLNTITVYFFQAQAEYGFIRGSHRT